jgi:hypothetical protein
VPKWKKVATRAGVANWDWYLQLNISHERKNASAAIDELIVVTFGKITLVLIEATAIWQLKQEGWTRWKVYAYASVLSRWPFLLLLDFLLGLAAVLLHAHIHIHAPSANTMLFVNFSIVITTRAFIIHNYLESNAIEDKFWNDFHFSFVSLSRFQ